MLSWSNRSTNSPCGYARRERAPGSGCLPPCRGPGRRSAAASAARSARHTPGSGRCRPGVQQTEVVVDLRDGADRRPRVAVGRLLVDGHRRRQTFDEVDVGLVHLTEELARVRRQRLDIASLALGEDRVERQTRLARARQPGEHDQAVAGQIEIDPSQIVLTGTPHDKAIRHSKSLHCSTTEDAHER